LIEGVVRTRDSDETTPRAKRGRTGPLSNREREVFELLADGFSGAQIAERLVLSPETVRTHIRNGMSKLGASTRSQAVVLALRRHEISAPGDFGQAPAPAPAVPASAPSHGLAGTNLTAPLELVVDGLLSLWDVDAGWIYLAEDNGLTLRRVVERTGAESLPPSIALGEGPLGRAALERRAQILQAPGAETGAMIVAPLLDGNRLIGVLGLAVRPSRPTGRKELLLLQALAGRLAELIGGGQEIGPGAEQALEGFRASWAAATRAV
jgi:DNA-binding CsgD family transcriptional regulator